jgi:hypothetical protein
MASTTLISPNNHLVYRYWETAKGNVSQYNLPIVLTNVSHARFFPTKMQKLLVIYDHHNRTDIEICHQLSSAFILCTTLLLRFWVSRPNSTNSTRTRRHHARTAHGWLLQQCLATVCGCLTRWGAMSSWMTELHDHIDPLSLLSPEAKSNE